MSLISLKKYLKIRIIINLKRNGFQVTVICFVTACMWRQRPRGQTMSCGATGAVQKTPRTSARTSATTTPHLYRNASTKEECAWWKLEFIFSIIFLTLLHTIQYNILEYLKQMCNGDLISKSSYRRPWRYIKYFL